MIQRRTEPMAWAKRPSGIPSATHSAMVSRAGRLAVAAGVVGGAIAASGGQPASAQAPGAPACINAIQGVDTTGWDVDAWDDFLLGELVGDEVVGGCVGNFGVGKLVINVLDKATGLPVDGTVNTALLLNAFQFGYEGFPAGSFDPYCDLRWGTSAAPGSDQFSARIGAEVVPPGADFRFQETGFGGRPLRFLQWIAPDAPVTPVDFDELQPHQIAFSWACDANFTTLTTPAIADVGGGFELLAGRNTGRSAADGTSDFRVPGSDTESGLIDGSEVGWQQINLYVSRRPPVVETTTTTTIAAAAPATTAPPAPAPAVTLAPPSTPAPAVLPPGPLPGILPETGRETGAFAVFAAFLLAIGAAAIGVSRRRPASR